jgi:hypothetical protein
MLGAPARNRKLVGTDWIAVFKKDCDPNMRVLFRGVEDAAGLVASHFRCRAVTFARDISFRMESVAPIFLRGASLNIK